MFVIARRRKAQPPPPWVVWEALTEPNRDPARPWLEPRMGETVPRVLEARHPTLVVWSSLWLAHPDDQIRFDLAPSGSDTSLEWSLLSPRQIGPEEVSPRRRRLNELINGQLRDTFG
ncbi:hypothetical protein MXD61_18660 [Frankia sp. AgPm24]|uniref:Uncharacterized protein n=1 Tax=Frankia umida TaxID=573489 RepID=A0ABT0K0Z8_9ACTN|nr:MULTISPECIES: hypothetical protein [Frankia]MCK9877405.1 hypothetical protein [Frankia umida]MCK9923864.1 hypothetical protein [Frankia sp. AgPm24]